MRSPEKQVKVIHVFDLTHRESIPETLTGVQRNLPYINFMPIIKQPTSDHVNYCMYAKWLVQNSKYRKFPFIYAILLNITHIFFC